MKRSITAFSVILMIAVVAGATFAQRNANKKRPRPVPLVQVIEAPAAVETSSGLVLSQVYGGGGNSGAPYQNDFIEIFNRGSVAVDITNWSVQYNAAAGASDFQVTNICPIGPCLVQPGQFLLVQESSGGANGVALPTANIIGAITMSASAGRVALVNNSTAILGAANCATQLSSSVDFVGYGAGVSCFEGGASTPAPGNATAAIRIGRGRTETDSNSADFLAALPVPRNSTGRLGQQSLDFNNDGRSDYSIYRARSASGNANIDWFVKLSGVNTELSRATWGLASDFPTPADYDGDGKTDIAVWRNDPQPVYYIIQSSNGVFRNFAFGVQNDFPLVTSDFDGDGKADPAIWREANQAQFWYQSSKYGGQVNVPWGTVGDIPLSGDVNGDGLGDFRVMRDDGAGNAVWYTRFSVPVGTALPPDTREYYGLTSDDFMPGDFDGDGKADLCAVRVEGASNNWVWYIKASSTGAITRTAWGRADLDTATPGDYDGDGRTDIAVWRFGSQGGIPANFYIINSSTGTGSQIQWGIESQTDFPLACWNTTAPVC